MLNNYTITQIEAMTYPEVYVYAIDKTTIKGHDILFVEFDNDFGYSALVFKKGKHINYANEYELHHAWRNCSKQELKEKYINILNHKLFTEDEFTNVENYDDYTKKEYYLRNYYHMQIDYISSFQIIHSDAEQKAWQKKVSNLIYDPISFCYVADAEFVKHHLKLWTRLATAWNNKSNDFETLKKAYLHEMFNHEYGINSQADYDVINVFKPVEYIDAGTNEYLKAAGFTDVEKKAYKAAKAEYFATAEF